jgi:DNA modification methylase
MRPSALIDTRVVYCGDCLDQLRKLPDACVDLIYIDPPFNSNRNYEVFWGESKERRSFEDRHESTQAYIEFMRPRCVELSRILKSTGSFYYHCDWHAAHYVKVMLDQILGESSFQNEIIWKRTSAHGDASTRFAAVHDTIFMYAKSKDAVWNSTYAPYGDDYVKEHFVHKDPDGRVFRRVDLRSPSPRPNLTYDYLASNGRLYRPHANGWAVSLEVMRQLDREGRLFFPAKEDARLRRKIYMDESPGVIVSDLWTDLPPIHASSQERLGYPTQKPLALLDRIIRASSNENDVVLDAFCGCGTALLSAERLKRQWIGIDISPTACRVMAKRLQDETTLREDEKLWKIGRGFVVRDLPWTEEQLRRIPPFEFENWAVIAIGGIPNKAQVGDMGIDGRIFPVSSMPTKREGALPFMDEWFPIQVKQKDKVGRPDIDSFEAVMMREDRKKGFIVSFDYTSDAEREILSFFQRSGKSIKLLTVKEILEEQIAMKMV